MEQLQHGTQKTTGLWSVTVGSASAAFCEAKKAGFFLKNSIVLTDVDSGNFRRGGGDSTKSSKNFEMPPGFWPPPTWEGNQKVKRGGSHTGLDAGVIHLGVHCAPLSKSSLGVS